MYHKIEYNTSFIYINKKFTYYHYFQVYKFSYYSCKKQIYFFIKSSISATTFLNLIYFRYTFDFRLCSYTKSFFCNLKGILSICSFKVALLLPFMFNINVVSLRANHWHLKFSHIQKDTISSRIILHLPYQVFTMSLGNRKKT